MVQYVKCVQWCISFWIRVNGVCCSCVLCVLFFFFVKFAKLMPQYGNVLASGVWKGGKWNIKHLSVIIVKQPKQCMHCWPNYAALLMWWASIGEEHRGWAVHCEQTTPSPLPKGKRFFWFLLTPLDYFKELLGLFEHHLTEWLFSGWLIKMQGALERVHVCSGWTAAPVHFQHEEIHPCVAADRDSALHSSCTGNFMSSLQVYHCKPLLQLFKSLV